jgi:RNA polymerase sigma-70 factor (ECF subfamily)
VARGDTSSRIQRHARARKLGNRVPTKELCVRERRRRGELTLTRSYRSAEVNEAVVDSGLVGGDDLSATVTSRAEFTSDAMAAEQFCDRDDIVTRLALAAGRGDRDAFERFMRSTQRDVWRFIAYLADTGSADDLTQETFLRAIGSLPRFKGHSSARTWLMSIARRVVVDQIRHEMRRPHTSVATDPSNVVELERFQSKRQPASGFEEVVEIRMLLEGLETDRRQALLLTQVLGLSYAEAAKVCGCPVGTIRSRVARARTDLINASVHGVDEHTPTGGAEASFSGRSSVQNSPES